MSEPVAWRYGDTDQYLSALPGYTPPPPWVPLYDEPRETTEQNVDVDQVEER